MIKKIRLILFLCIQIVWAEDSCDFATDIFVTQLEKKYIYKIDANNLIPHEDEHTITCKKNDETSNAIMVINYKGKVNKEDKSLIEFITVISVIDYKAKIIKQSRLYSVERGASFMIDKVVIDLKNYKNSISDYSFSVTLVTFTAHSFGYLYEYDLLVYAIKKSKLKMILSKLESKGYPTWQNGEKVFRWMVSYNDIDYVLKKHQDIEFLRHYTFGYIASNGEHKYWDVTLDEPKKYVYKDGKYELVKKKYKPIFDLNTVLLNTQKGLKYKEIVLRAMLHEEPLTEDNFEVYTQIAQALKKAKHTKEAEFLKDIVLTAFPKQEKLFQVKSLKKEPKNVKERSLLACQFIHEQWGVCHTLYSSVESFEDTHRAYFKTEIIRPKGEVDPNGELFSKTLKPYFQYISAKCKEESVDGYIYTEDGDSYGKGGQGVDYTYELIAPLLCASPKFDNFRASDRYDKPNKPLIQKGFGRLYRTLLKKALKEKKPEFAGKHIIAQWGCDEGKNGCVTGGIIDTSTGKAIPFPFKQYEVNGNKEIIYKLNSSLIIFAGDFKFKDGRTQKNKVLFYEFKDGEFLFLKGKGYK